MGHSCGFVIGVLDLVGFIGVRVVFHCLLDRALLTEVLVFIVFTLGRLGKLLNFPLIMNLIGYFMLRSLLL